MLDCRSFGGQAGASARIENYLGFPTGISGMALMARAYDQAQKFGVQLAIPDEAVSLSAPLFGQIDVDCQPQVIAQRGNLEKQTVGIRRRLTQFQITRPDFVGLRSMAQQHTPNAEKYCEASHCAISDAAALSGGSTTTSQRARSVR
jgi:hypothetical protein